MNEPLSPKSLKMLGDLAKTSSDVKKLLKFYEDKIAEEHASNTERAIDFVGRLNDSKRLYHNHKERMGHAAFLVLLALGLGFLIRDVPDWVPTLVISKEWLAFLGAACGWFIAYYYVGWQLQNRYAAAVVWAATLRVLRDWTTGVPQEAQWKPYDGEDSDRFVGELIRSQKQQSRLSFLGGITSLWGVIQIQDDRLREFPAAVAERIRSKITDGSGAARGEWVVYFGAWALLLIMMFKTIVAQ